MKKYLLKPSVLLLLLLSACGKESSNQVQNPPENQASASSTKEANNTQELPNDTEKTAKQYWNSDKQEKFNTFFAHWSTDMGQDYQSYGQEAFGMRFPDRHADYFGEAIAYNGNRIPIEWSVDGSKNDVYNVVSIYYEVNAKYVLSPRLYYFVIYNGQPVTMVTEQNQGSPDQLLHFRDTENVALRDGFASIVNE